MFFVRGDGMAEIGCGCRGGVAIVLFMVIVVVGREGKKETMWFS